MVTNVMIVTAFVLAVFFPLAYSRSKWTLYPPGRALMLFSIIVAATLGLGVYRVFTGELAPDWVRGIAFSLIVAGLLIMNVVLLREQSADRKHDREEKRVMDESEKY